MSHYMEAAAKATIDAITAQIDPVQVRPVTIRFIANLLLHLPLTSAQRDDFGIACEMQLDALRAVLEVDTHVGHVAARLDQALGNGPALTALVKEWAPEFGDLTFTTIWDRYSAR